MQKMFFLLILWFCYQPQDIKKGFSVGKPKKNPQSIPSAYRYDPVTDRYVYTNSVDGFSINYPIILTPKEYERLVLKNPCGIISRKK
jgi:hypothetical protein